MPSKRGHTGRPIGHFGEEGSKNRDFCGEHSRDGVGSVRTKSDSPRGRAKIAPLDAERSRTRQAFPQEAADGMVNKEQPEGGKGVFVMVARPQLLQRELVRSARKEQGGPLHQTSGRSPQAPFMIGVSGPARSLTQVWLPHESGQKVQQMIGRHDRHGRRTLPSRPT